MVIAIEGKNFTGRSAYLKKRVSGGGHHDSPVATMTRGTPGAYLGTDAHNYLSGLLPSVRGELVLHGFCTSPRREAVEGLLASAGLPPTACQNPLTLSGGQQVVLALSTALLSTGTLIAIDCSLEQLSPRARAAVLDVLGREDSQAKSVIVDNRLVEFRERVAVEPVDDPVLEPRPSPPRMSWTAVRPQSDVPHLELQDVTFRYSLHAPLLEALSCRFNPGTVNFIEGPNGVGKSTLGKLLCGILRPSQGNLLLEGRPWRPWEKPGDVVAYHFQNPDLQLFTTSVARQFGEDVRDITAAFGLESFLSDHPHNLPFVLRKRIALAIALARRRPWLILDEPILGQDDDNARVLARILDDAAAMGAGIVVLSHSTWFRSLITRKRTCLLSMQGLKESTPCNRVQ